jgi:uncharacterized protein DUF6627
VIICVLLAAFAPFQAVSAPIPSKVATTSLEDENDRRIISSTIETDQVARRLSSLGYGPDAVRFTLDHLSAGDVHQLAHNIRQLQAGGGTRARAWITAAIVVVVLVVIIVYVENHSSPGRVL